MKPINILILSFFIVFSSASIAKGKLAASALNSPAKESYIIVKLEGVETISEVAFKPRNGGEEKQGELVKEGSHYFGKFKASELAPGSYEYRVKVRTTSGKSQQNQAASVAFVKFEIDPSLEVADPGEAGKKTLLGIDSDNDGVRDDVQRWINETYSGKESTKKALKQLSKVMNKRITTLSSKQDSILASHLLIEAVGCLDWIDNFEANSNKSIAFRKVYNNTPERIKAKLEADGNFHGQGPGPKAMNTDIKEFDKLCDFKALKND